MARLCTLFDTPGLRWCRRAALTTTMRILLVTETLITGGAETFVVRLANALSASHQVTIAVMHGELIDRSLLERVGPAVHVERLMLPAKRMLFRADTLLRRVKIDRSIIRRAQRRWLASIVDHMAPDVIHSHLLKADRIAADICADRPTLRHVVTLHGDYAPFLLGQADPQMLRTGQAMAAIFGGADGIAAICRQQVEFVTKEFPGAAGRTRMIYNGYAPWRATHHDKVRDDHALTFGMVSRGVERKGWAKAVAAFAKLPTGAARLVLVGEGPAIDRLRSEPLPENVQFAGFSADPTAWIEAFDVGILPTEFSHESLPTVVMEYLDCGKPVIATDVGEIRVMMTAPDGNLAGTLLDFDDDQISTDQLAAAMQAYLDDPDLRLRHAALARAASAKFDMAECAAAYVRLYEDVVASSSSTIASH